MSTPTDIRAQLTRDEGYRPHPYFDCCGKPFRQCKCKAQGKLTVGVGRNLEDVPLSITEAEYLLSNDISRATAGVMARIPWALSLGEVRLGAVVNMAFNLGVAGLLGFRKALAAMERGDWSAAAAEMLDSKWRKQVGVRAERLARQVESGEWQ